MVAAGSYIEMLNLPPLDSVFAVDDSRDMFLFKYATESPNVEVVDVTGLDGCADSLLEVHAQLRGYFPPTNQISIELSDATGNFAAAPMVGSATTGVSGIVRGGIPLSYPDGNGYRVRLTTTDPALSSNVNGVDLTFETELNPPLALIGDTTVCNGSSTFIQVPTGYDSVLWSNGSTSGFTQFSAPAPEWVRAVDQNGCSQILAFNIVECVAREDELDFRVQLFPNPGSGRYQLHVDDIGLEPVQIQVFDALGRQVLQQTMDGPRAVLNLTLQPSGIYMVNLQSASRSWTGKLILRR